MFDALPTTSINNWFTDAVPTWSFLNTSKSKHFRHWQVCPELNSPEENWPGTTISKEAVKPK